MDFCFCGCSVGSHDVLILVCTTRHCNCLKYSRMLSRQGNLKRAVLSPLAVDLARHRLKNKMIVQKVLVGLEESS